MLHIISYDLAFIFSFQHAIDNGHAIVANLGNISTGDVHCVMIYAFEKRRKSFKIKDSHGFDYEIPLERPDFFQVIFG